MALSRKFLAALGIEEDKVDEIIKAHSETVDALKEERDQFKEKAEKYDKAQSDLEEAQKKIEDLSKDDTYKVKYDALKEDFDEYKKGVETEKTNKRKEAVRKQLLIDIGVPEKRTDILARLVELDRIKLGKDGNAENAEELKKSLAEELSDFTVKDGKEGADISTPPEKSGSVTKTREEIMQIKDTSERQKAWGDLIRNGGIKNGSSTG